MAASMATMAMILRSIASAPVGGPGGASGSGTATRAAYHNTAPRTTSRKAAANSAGRLMSTRLRSGGRRHRVGGVGDRARNGFRRTGVDGNPARGIDLEREAIHRPRRRALNDLAVAV